MSIGELEGVSVGSLGAEVDVARGAGGELWEGYKIIYFTSTIRSLLFAVLMNG